MILSISIWSCTSSWQGGRGGVKLYYQLTYLVDFANSYYVLLYILLFCTPSCSLTLFGIILYFLGMHLNFFFFYLVLYLQLVGSQEAQNGLPARGVGCIFSHLCPILSTVCSFYFSGLQISLTLIQSITSGQQDHRMLRKYLKCSLQYASCTSSWQYFLNLLRSYQLEVQDQIKINVNILL